MKRFHVFKYASSKEADSEPSSEAESEVVRFLAPDPSQFRLAWRWLHQHVAEGPGDDSTTTDHEDEACLD